MTVVRRIASPVVRPLVRAINAAYGISAFTPARLFTTGVNGAWYDPSDYSTLFRDAAGTLPVTAVEQPVGLMLDKSKGLVLGSELVTNGTFDAGIAGWTSANFGSLSWDGTNQRLRLTTSGGTFGRGYTTIPTTAGKWYEVRANVWKISGSGYGLLSANTDATASVSLGSSSTQNGSASQYFRFLAQGSTTYLFVLSTTSGDVADFDNISVRELPGNHAFNGSGNSANFPVLSARYNQYLSTETLTTQNVTTVAANYTLSFTGTGSITLSGTATGTYSAGTHTITCTAGTLTSTVSGTVTKADLRVANDALNQPAYQRVNTSTDYDTVGFKPYLRFNGTNQWLQTNSIDFSYGDKMFVSAGVRRLGAGIICETGVNASAINGSFHVYTENLLYQLASRGTVLMSIVPVVPSLPITDIITGKYEISTPLLLARRNGSVIGQSSQTQGTGNYGNYPLYIGARAGSSLWFNGRLYQMVVAGKQVSAAEITSTETYLNQKTGAF